MLLKNGILSHCKGTFPNFTGFPCGDTLAIKYHSATVWPRHGCFFHVAISKLVDKVTPVLRRSRGTSMTSAVQ